jgi:hypothetical protein
MEAVHGLAALNMAIPTVAAAKKAVARIVRRYNTKRPHLSMGMLTPEVAHPLERRWKNYYRKETKEQEVRHAQLWAPVEPAAQGALDGRRRWRV